MRNPLLEEAAAVYMRRREYLTLHLAYVAGMALFLTLLWPARGLLYFFRTESTPAAFQAFVIAQVIAVCGISLAAGLDRLAESQIIRYSEWIERTGIPIRILGTGKLLAGIVHTTVLVIVGIPFAVVAAGPAGITLDVVAATELVVLLAGITGRIAGMLIGHLGETRYFIRVTGAWIYLALIFVATIRIGTPLNPIIAVVEQHAPGPGGGASLLTVSLAQLAAAALIGVGFWISLARHRVQALRRAEAEGVHG
jgi:hypothetical protein